MKPLFFTSASKLVLATVCAASATWAQPARRESSEDARIQDLESQDLRTRLRALSDLLAQSGVDSRGHYNIRVRVNSLVRTHPLQAERIKTALIAALEREGAEFARPAASDAQQAEGQAEYTSFLTEVVAALQDPRAVRGMILALPAGSIEGLVDICPTAAGALVERVHEPDVYEEGRPLGYRWLPITALSWCLERPAMMRANPEMVNKIRAGLLGMLDDPDPIIRGGAAHALSPLRADPEVQEKLRKVAANDPYAGTGYDGAGYDHGPGTGSSAGPFMVREAAARSLAPPDGFSFYVTRTSSTRVCQLKEASEAPVEERFMGPEAKNLLRPMMCSHYDPTGQDPSLCWKIEPADACHQ